jgi:uncharacterized protein
METLNTNIKNTASLIHLSTFLKYLIPFGNIIAPLIIWSANKKRSYFIDKNGKQVLNFQLSMLLYLVIMILIFVPFGINFGFNMFELINTNTSNNYKEFVSFGGTIGILIVITILNCILLLLDLITSIIGTIKARKGKIFKYPLSIKFIK